MLLVEGIFTKSKVVECWKWHTERLKMEKNKKKTRFCKKKKLAREKVSGISLTKCALPDQKKIHLD